MKTCNGCKHADWDKTVTWKLYLSGEGACTAVVRVPALPQAYHWVHALAVKGGHIDRNTPLKEHCVYFSQGD